MGGNYFWYKQIHSKYLKVCMCHFACVSLNVVDISVDCSVVTRQTASVGF